MVRSFFALILLCEDFCPHLAHKVAQFLQQLIVNHADLPVLHL